MASNYTEQYKLCQWEATDQVLRTDFNEDNQKIEAAIKEVRNEIISAELLFAKFAMIDDELAALEQRLTALGG